jgi:hypothetical protein
LPTPPPPATPGPGAYERGPVFRPATTAIHPYFAPLAPFATPGPGRYDTQFPSHPQALSPRIGPALALPKPEHPSESPYYGVPRFGDRTAQKTIHAPVHGPRCFNGPGPGAYDPQADRADHAGGYMPAKAGRDKRESWLVKSSTPGPGKYWPMADKAEPSAPKWSFGSNLRSSWTYGQKNPSPAQYSAEKPTYSPRFSIRNRYPLPEPEHSTGRAGYYVIPPEKRKEPLIHTRDYLDLVPK